MKGMFSSLIGSLAAMGHATAGDEILKNPLTNFAFEFAGHRRRS
jgi:hypothetical protein